MKRWVVLIIVAAVCAAAAIAYGWWLPPLLRFLGIKGDLIQTLARLLALVPATVSAVTGILGLKQRAKAAARVHNETVIGQKVAIRGDPQVGDIVGRDKITTVQVQAKPPESALHQLPAPPRDFTGREAEIKELLRELKKQGAIISCQGMGGVGKTALALVLAHRLADRYGDAQIFVDLRGASTQQPVSVAEAMAHVVRAWDREYKRPEDENQVRADYHAALNGKRAILLMDNARDRAQVEPLIPSETCILLVTTRQHFTLPGLYARELHELPPDDARKLLLRIVPRVGDAAEDLARLCGHLPFALCLAGSALAVRLDLTPAEYVNRLSDAKARLGLIDGTLSLSYDLLQAGSQRRFAILAVFPGTFDRDGAAAVLETKSEAAQDALAELVAYSLVEFDEGTRRYRLHDLARVFADSRLSEQDRGDAQRCHAAHYFSVLWATDKLYKQGGGSVLAGLALFDIEWENIEAGQAWAAANAPGDDAAARLCSDYAGAGAYCIDLRLHPRENIRWLESALAAARRLRDRLAEGPQLGSLGNAYYVLGEIGRAIEYYERALAIAREMGDRRGEGSNLGNLGNACAALGETRRAVEYYEQRLKIAREIGDRSGEGQALGNLGVAYRNLGEAGRAIRYHEQALVIDREMGDRRGEGQDLGNLGGAYAALGETCRAMEYCRQHLKIAREIGDRRSEGNALCGLGSGYYVLGETRRAIEYYELHLSIAREIGDRHGEGLALCGLGNGYSTLGEPRRAIGYHEQHLKIAREIGHRSGEGQALGNLGVAYRNLGEAGRAIEYHEQALVIEREMGDRRSEGQVLGNLGNAYAALGEMRRAIECHEQALAIDREIGDQRGEASDLGNLGNAYAALGEIRRAIEYYERALAIDREIGDKYGEGNSLGNLGSAYFLLGEIRRAMEYWEEGMNIAREIGDRYGEGNTLWNMALALKQLGRVDEAILSAEAALAIFEAIEDPNAEMVRKGLQEWRKAKGGEGG